MLPEYAVDFTFASKAGEDPDKYAPLALANMTGGNRLLIGIGWSMVVLLAAWRITRIARTQGYEGELDTEVHLDRPHAIEIAFLAIASLYSLTLPFKTRSLCRRGRSSSGCSSGTRSASVARRPRSRTSSGPAELIGRLPTAKRDGWSSR